LMPLRVMVCKKCKGHACLEDVLTRKTNAVVVPVQCQKICHGPVAGLDVNGRTEWFERLSKAKSIVELVRLVRRRGEGEIRHSLEKRRVRRHSGRRAR
jgi:hypothetical protein